MRGESWYAQRRQLHWKELALLIDKKMTQADGWLGGIKREPHERSLYKKRESKVWFRKNNKKKKAAIEDNPKPVVWFFAEKKE